jgi:hypothetical protein
VTHLTNKKGNTTVSMTTQTSEHEEEAALTEMYQLMEAGMPEGEALSQVVQRNPTNAAFLSDAILLNTYEANEAEGLATEVRVSIDKALDKRRPSVLVSLKDAATASGLNMPDVAERAKLPLSVLAKLNARLIDYTSIPKNVVEQVADVVNETSDRIEQYLRLPPAHNLALEHRRFGARTMGVESFEAAMLAASANKAE